MPRGHNMLTALLALLMPVAVASGTEITLQTNPFEAPPEAGNQGTQQDSSQVEVDQQEMDLRGTMAAGQYSLADIGGEILAIGQEINGYTLVAVHKRRVVLQKNDVQRTLYIDKDKGKAR